MVSFGAILNHTESYRTLLFYKKWMNHTEFVFSGRRSQPEKEFSDDSANVHFAFSAFCVLFMSAVYNRPFVGAHFSVVSH